MLSTNSSYQPFFHISKYIFLYVSNGKDRKSKPKLTNTICATVFKVEIGEISTLKTNHTDSTSNSGGGHPPPVGYNLWKKKEFKMRHYMLVIIMEKLIFNFEFKM